MLPYFKTHFESIDEDHLRIYFPKIMEIPLIQKLSNCESVRKLRHEMIQRVNGPMFDKSKPLELCMREVFCELFSLKENEDLKEGMKFSMEKPTYPRTRSLISATSIEELQMKLGGSLDDYRITIGDTLFAIEHDLWEHLNEKGGVHELVAVNSYELIGGDNQVGKRKLESYSSASKKRKE